jgi:hypothetical protein
LDVIVVALTVLAVMLIALAVVPVVVVLVALNVVSPSPDSIDTVCSEDSAAARRRPPTPMPSAPVRDGPSIVCVYLSLVAPGKPDTLRGRVPDAAAPPSDSSGESGGLGGTASSGHFVASASEAAVMYGLVAKEGSKEMRRGPYGSSAMLRR